ncbi:MAG: bifunctional folylpolyglutamate synthase/dihydrofolate synthase [Firmicutes bacterium]|nr:bifunctional folylpolyglutamate synthase/dihydrofolate synthase [Bacillota bacterium]
MNRKQAEDMVYRSYMKAAKKLDYNAPDSQKRRPELTKAVIRQLDEYYKNRNILVTGSKGKGSVSVMIQAILCAHGKNTGLMTSPHILEFNERIRINGTYISDMEFAEYADKIRPTLELIDSTIAENEYVSPIGVQVLLALLHFGHRTDFNIFECGKGAQYDDVNNLSREYSVINRIFAEHTRELGATEKEIALDKAHIIKKRQKFAYTAKQEDTVMRVLEERAEKCGVELKKYGADFCCRNVRMTEKGTEFDIITKKAAYTALSLPLLGAHQAENAALALAVCEDILGEIDETKVRTAFANVHWAGRMEIISRNPLTIVDACINRKSAEHLKEIIMQLPHKSLAAVIGIPADKDYKGTAEIISEIADKIIMTAADNPHYKFDKSQAEGIKNAVFAGTLEKALKTVQKSKPDILLILGTTALVAELYKKSSKGEIPLDGGYILNYNKIKSLE